MNALSRFAGRYPILTYVLLCFGITWSIWFCIPLFAGADWTLIKIMLGVGLGPGLAAVFLDRLRGTAGPVTGKWWAGFSIVFVLVAILDFSSQLTGDGGTAQEFAVARPPGITAVGTVGTLLSAAVCGFIFASAAASRAITLNSIIRWRVPPVWFLIALLLPTALSLASWGIALVTGATVSGPLHGGLPTGTWAGFLLRSLLYTLLVVAIGEEVGWRGWMLPELQKRFNPLLSSLVLGVVWGVWHFPLFVIHAYPGPPSGALSYLVIGPVAAILFTWVYNRTGANLFLALILHTAINNTPRLVPAGPLLPALLIGLVVILIVADRMWRRRSEAA
jgi:uncharacterized protein